MCWCLTLVFLHFSVIQKPILLIDVIDTYTEFGYVLTSFSFGE